MKRWDKSYTRAIITVVVIIIMFGLFHWLDNRSYSFDGSDELSSRLENWSPQTAEKAESQDSQGEILFYSIDSFKHYVFLKEYVGPGQANRKFLKSNIRSIDEVGLIAVLYYNADPSGTYSNGATAYTVTCTVYILDKDLRILAQDSLSGSAPSSTTSGGDRYGDYPDEAKCKDLALKLISNLQ